MRISFERREELAATIWQYHFKPERAVDFVPGQYASFHLPSLTDDPRGPARTYTLTSLPGDEFISFIIKIVDPVSRYKQVLQQLIPGNELEINDAMGDLVLPKSRDIPLVFIAGGIGIASFGSMIQQLLNSREERQVFFFYRLRDQRERIFTDLIKAYPLVLNQLVIAPHQLTAAEIKAATPPDALIYISGCQSFTENLRRDLIESGTPHEYIVFDYFDGYADL